MHAMTRKQATGSLLDLVQRFRQLRVLVTGEAMLDTYLEGDATRLCSEGPVPVVRKTAEYRIPGGAANTAANLAALDAEVMFLSIVGRDIAGSLLREALREREVSDAWLVEDASVPTHHKLRILANGQYMVRFDEGEMLDATNAPDTQQQLLAHLEEIYPRCDLVLISDYCYGVVSEQLIERLQTLHASQPKVLLIDSKALHRFQTLPATIVTPNYQEACYLTSSQKRVHTGDNSNASPGKATELEQIRAVAQQLLAQLATEQVAITLAERGVFLLNRRGDALHIPAHPVDHANDVGAGDSFASALALALAAGGSTEEAAQIAIDAASIAVTKRWTAVVQHQELLQRVSLREYARHASAASGESEHNSPARLAALLETQKRAGRKIVFTNGVFDILHAGHMQFLQQARALGDVLIVGVNSDNSARRLKGKGRPINSERDRMALVAALDMVDHVVLFDEDTPTQLIRLLRPDIHVKGGDYTYEALPEAEAVREAGGRIVILPLAGSISTSSVIDRIAALSAQESEHYTRGKR
jgi:D-beta-D-heptose 7-phosphate kinase/D-beta-D-heptose 1-phosphate adenosyltransferase